ncbi:hypothetical protein PANO111632_05610 [Paracoccus nototheniae]|uniref:Uncharacterized protein n=1 Tax=Paracoccus nototheniae TaxID=2489002 RepID=A0ABW4E0E8_9RHOB|nr:hypothetical protein [Paracoccus nototheniae]
MSRPSAPSMPTERQIQDAFKAVTLVNPGARIARVGPEGITFEHPDERRQSGGWDRKPFSAVQA